MTITKILPVDKTSEGNREI